jgi:hypothetical protein
MIGGIGCKFILSIYEQLGFCVSPFRSLLQCLIKNLQTNSIVK